MIRDTSVLIIDPVLKSGFNRLYTAEISHGRKGAKEISSETAMIRINARRKFIQTLLRVMSVTGDLNDTSIADHADVCQAFDSLYTAEVSSSRMKAKAPAYALEKQEKARRSFIEAVVLVLSKSD